MCLERASNSEENALILEAKVENAVVKAAEAGVAAAGSTESASEDARLSFRAIDGILSVENTVTSQGDRIDRLEEDALNNLSPDILQVIKIVSSELDLANALTEVTNELIVPLESMYVENILGDRTTDRLVGDAETLREINKRLADVCTGIHQGAAEKVSLPSDMIQSSNDSLYITVFDWIGSSTDIPFVVTKEHILDFPVETDWGTLRCGFPVQSRKPTCWRSDNNGGAQRYLFSGRFQISGDRITQLLRAIRLREDYSDEKITHHQVGWSPVRNHPVNVRGGQVSDWEESQVLAALTVSELSAALQ